MHSCFMQEGLVELFTTSKEEQPITSACCKTRSALLGVQDASLVTGEEYETGGGTYPSVFNFFFCITRAPIPPCN